MKKTDTKTGGETQSLLNVKTYSVSEILTAGGTTAFANQLGKNTRHTVERLKALEKDDFLTNEEANAALQYLKNNK